MILKTVQKHAACVRGRVGALYLCVHLCTSGVSEPFLLIVGTGMEGVGAAEINAKTVWSAVKLCRTLIQYVCEVNKRSDHTERTMGFSTLQFDIKC